jgi:hypothetical protein
VWNLAVLLGIAAFLSWRFLRAAELRALSERLGYDGPAQAFPIAHFRQVAPAGASPQEVWARVGQVASVHYYSAPIVGASDSVVIQRFAYPLRWGDLTVDVEYHAGAVRDVETTGETWLGMVPLSNDEAYRRLGWRP